MDVKMFGRVFCCLALVLACGVAAAQKGTEELDSFGLADHYINTWMGEVTAVDNDRRELTLTYTKGAKKENFVVFVPAGEYVWTKDLSDDRVLNFVPSDKRVKTVAPEERYDLKEFMGRLIKVYYTRREGKAGDKKVKFNEVVRVKFLKNETNQKKDGKQP